MPVLGYNGTPRGMRNCNEGGCARCNSTSVSSLAANGSAGSGVATPVKSGVALDECLCLHAEENALLEAGRDRAEGGVLYCNT
jgi:dCMP deaminase